MSHCVRNSANIGRKHRAEKKNVVSLLHDIVYPLHEIVYHSSGTDLDLQAAGNAVGLDTGDGLASDALDLVLLLRSPLQERQDQLYFSEGIAFPG